LIHKEIFTIYYKAPRKLLTGQLYLA